MAEENKNKIDLTGQGSVPSEVKVPENVAEDTSMVTEEASVGADIPTQKKSGAQRRRELWLNYYREVEKARAEGRELPPPPPKRKAGSKKGKGNIEAGARTRLMDPGTSGAPQEEGQSEAMDRKRKDRSVSDPTIKPVQKRRKQGQCPAQGKGPSFAAAAANLPRVMVTFGEGVGGRMEMAAFDHLKGTVMDRIMDSPEGAFIPRFKDTFLREGVATFICNDGESEKWLREAVPSIKLEDGSQARLVLPEELIKRVRMTVLVPPPRRDATQLVKLLGRQNPELDTSGWKILQSVERGPGALLILGVDEKSAERLNARGGKAFLGTGEVTFRVNSKDPEGKED